MVFFVISCAIPAFMTTWVVTSWVRRQAPRWGLIDRPDARKTHDVPTPLGGGIGVWAGVTLPLILALLAARLALHSGTFAEWLPPILLKHAPGAVYRGDQLLVILSAGSLLAIMGLLDDLRNLPWAPRLLVQLLTAIGVVAGGVQATVFLPAPWLGQLITVLWIMVLVNSFNFLDNMDGLSAGIGMIVSVIFAIIMLAGTSEPRWLVGGVLLVLAGSLAAFLCFNRPPAKIFMGDAGSYFVGLMLACMTVVGTFYEGQGGSEGRHVMLAPLFVLAIPLYDFCSVLAIRLSRGLSPFHPDRNHFSHRLVELGFSRGQAVLTVHLTTLTTGLAGLLLYRVKTWADALLLLMLLMCVLLIVAVLETIGRRDARNGSSF